MFNQEVLEKEKEKENGTQSVAMGLGQAKISRRPRLGNKKSGDVTTRTLGEVNGLEEVVRVVLEECGGI